MRATLPIYFSLLPLLAQTAGQDAVIRVTVDLVQVDATVTDSQGHHYPNLGPEDFVILEDGKPQKITHFSYVAGTVAPAVPQPVSQQRDRTPEVLNLAPAKPLTEQQVHRTIVMLADDLGLSADDIPNVRKAMKSFVDTQMQPGDLISVMTTSGGMGAMEQLTNDRSRLYAAIDRIRYAVGRVGLTWYDPVNIDESYGPLDPSAVQNAAKAHIGAIRNPLLLNRSMGAVAYAIRGLGEMPGRKALALFSDGFSQSPTGIIELANRSSVVVYTLDPRGIASYFLTAADECRCGQKGKVQMVRGAEASRQAAFRISQRGLDQLARGTGGTFFHDDNDLIKGLARSLDDMNGYYLIGYQPRREDFDQVGGTTPFHKIEVKVVRPGLSVRSRNGFFGRPDLPPAPKTSAPESDLRKAILSPFQANGFPVRLSAFYSADAGKPGTPQTPLQTKLRTLLMIDARDLKREEAGEGKQRLTLDVVAALWGQDDQQVTSVDNSFTIEKPAADMDQAVKSGLAVEIDVPAVKPGPYQVRAAVRETASGQLGSATAFVDVPDFKLPRIALSSVLLSDSDPARAEALEKIGVMGAGSPSTRVFASGATLNYECEVFGTHMDKASSKPHVEIEVHLFRGPELIFSGHPITVPAGAATNPIPAAGTIRLPDFLPPGDYALELTAYDGVASPKRAHAAQWIDFTLAK